MRTRVGQPDRRPVASSCVATTPKSDGGSEMERLVTVKELASATGLPVSYWYLKAEQGKVPCYKIGKYVRFRLSEVTAWLDQHRRTPEDKGNG